MQQPVLVREYSGRSAFIQTAKTPSMPSLPPIAAYAFADIIRSADGPEFRSAIEGIAEICAKNRLSLAEEHESHRPPVGEITEASSRSVGPELRKPGIHRALTTVPEGSSGSSEGSQRKKGIFGLRRKGKELPPSEPRIIQLGKARTLRVEGTTAMTKSEEPTNTVTLARPSEVGQTASSSSSTAVTSLQRLLTAMIQEPD